MADDTKATAGPVKEMILGEHVDIPKVSSIAAGVRIRENRLGRALWSRGGSIVVFVMASILPLAPVLLLVLLLRQPDAGSSGLTWVWVTMGVITEAIAFLVAYGLVRSVLEAEQ